MIKTSPLSIFVVLISILLSGLIPAVNVSGAEQLSSPQTNLQDQPYAFTFTGNSHFSEKDLLKAAAAELQIFEQRNYRKSDIDDAAFQMQSAYLTAGFAFAFVDYTYDQENNIIHITFRWMKAPGCLLKVYI